MGQSRLTMQECRTTLSGAEVLTRAKGFFSRNVSLYATFLDKEGPTFCTFRGQGGEEIVIGVEEDVKEGGTLVTGSTYLFDMQVARFFTTLPPFPPEDYVSPASAGPGGAVE
jgi:hypothetical protein